MPGVRVSDRMRQLYQGLSAYGTRGPGPDGRIPRSDVARVYGELTTIGIRQLIAAMEVSPGDHFVDLGSGAGKVVLQVALSIEGVTCKGIEIDRDRHRIAEDALQRAATRGLIATGKCVFHHDDILTADLQGATALFANSTCFPTGLLNRLARRVATLPGAVRFGTLRPLPPRIATLFHAHSTHTCAASWSRHMAVSVYRR